MSTLAAEVSVPNDIASLALAAKQAGRRLAILPTAEKDRILLQIADSLERNALAVLAANAEDAALAADLVETGRMSQALYHRLLLSPEKYKAMIDGVKAVAKMPDPAGQVLLRTLLDDGLVLEKVSVPLGLLAVIFEARPDAITQISALAIKSGNAVILKGGREVERTMRAVLDAIHDGIASAQLESSAVGVN